MAWSPEWYPSSSEPWVLFANELLQPYHIPACLRKPPQHAPGGEPLKTKFQKWAFLKKSVGAWHRGDIATLEAVNAAYVLDICAVSMLALIAESFPSPHCALAVHPSFAEARGSPSALGSLPAGRLSILWPASQFRRPGADPDELR